MNNRNQITISVIKEVNGRETTNPIGPVYRFSFSKFIISMKIKLQSK